MEDIGKYLRQWRSARTPLVAVTLTEVRGSTPREAGALMLVGENFLAGTVGGGALEHECVALAHDMLRRHETLREHEFVLGGNNVSQCCGGRAYARLERVTDVLAFRLEQAIADEKKERPTLLMFGAGHVGRALAQTLAFLPLRLIWIDSRAAEFGAIPPDVDVRITGNWEAVLEEAPAGAGVLVLTPDHALDALIVEAALLRGDLAYVGLIGSLTKRRRFEASFRELGISEDRLGSLVCPIGNRGVRDKRPEVIAALVTAEVVERLLHSPLRKNEKKSASLLPESNEFFC